jgi:hypothetical protein
MKAAKLHYKMNLDATVKSTKGFDFKCNRNTTATHFQTSTCIRLLLVFCFYYFHTVMADNIWIFEVQSVCITRCKSGNENLEAFLKNRKLLNVYKGQINTNVFRRTNFKLCHIDPLSIPSVFTVYNPGNSVRHWVCIVWITMETPLIMNIA